MKSAPYIGSRLSLITKSEIRYEGILYEINAAELTVTLENVTVHGTEGRKKNIKEVSPSDTMYDYVVFKSADIINLSVHETPSTLLVDPAIVSVPQKLYASSKSTESTKNSQTPFHPTPIAPPTQASEQKVSTMHSSETKLSQSKSSNILNRSAITEPKYLGLTPSDSFPYGKTEKSSTGISDNRKPARDFVEAASSSSSVAAPSAAVAPSAVAASGLQEPQDRPRSYTNPRGYPNYRYHGYYDRSSQKRNSFPSTHEIPKSDFDFNLGMSKMKPTDVLEKLNEEDISTYQKSNFFDNLSCESKERKPYQRGRHREDFQLNVETFGRMSLNNGPRHYYRGGGYRGYRGGSYNRGESRPHHQYHYQSTYQPRNTIETHSVKE